MVLATAERAWGHRWRSSKAFILFSMGMALFTDQLLYGFIVPMLPYIFRRRMGLDVSIIQRSTMVFLAQGALVSVFSSPIVGHFADRASSKKKLLLYSLTLTLISTMGLAFSASLPLLFVSRFVQSLASNALWIVGTATLADNIGSEHMGKVSGMISTVAAAGTSGGPLIAGVLFELGGYWTSWAGAYAFILVDIVTRLLMIEQPKSHTGKGKSEPAQVDSSEQESLLVCTASQISSSEQIFVEEKTGWRFYACTFRHSGFFAGVVSYFVFSVLIAAFDTTLPLHVLKVFNWGTFQVGLLFAALQGPGMVLSPMFGWLKDRVGSRWPTTIGFLSVAPFMWLLGVPGDRRFEWASIGTTGQAIYAVSVAMIGCLLCLLNGIGALEVTLAIDDIEASQPGVFGPNGGYSRALAMSSMAWTSGLLIGPILSGTLVDSVGYYEMECVLAFLCLLAGLNAAYNLTSRPKKERNKLHRAVENTQRINAVVNGTS